MYRAGAKEVEAVARVIRSQKYFRYTAGQCDRFEARFARMLGVKHVDLASSGAAALTAALVGLGIGPGDEVIVPAHTYLASANAVLCAGAIPVVCDIDDSLTIDPISLETTIGPRTRAVMAVHMWGLPCDMAAVMRIARHHKLLVLEDVAQACGGSFGGKPLGSIGHAGAFSFNEYKVISSGEGGAISTNSRPVHLRAECMVDPCRFFWHGKPAGFEPFVTNGTRFSEIDAALLNAQLDRLPSMLRAMRRQKQRVLRGTKRSGLTPIKANDPAGECGTHVGFTLDSPAAAAKFAKAVGGYVAGKTGRHTHIYWDPVLHKRGSHHPALDPFKLKENRGCRMNYSRTAFRGSVDLLMRTVLIKTHPDHTAAQVAALIGRINKASDHI